MTYTEAAALLRSLDNIALITHRNPDGDTLGSASALCSALRRIGKTAYLYPNSGITQNYYPYVLEYMAESSRKFSAYVSVDCSTRELFCSPVENEIVFCIDHHPTNTHYAVSDLVEPHMSACAECVYELILALTGNLTPEEATLLYIGLTTDTGCFQYLNTDEHSFDTAAKLTAASADIHRVHSEFFLTKTYSRIMLEGMIYSGLAMYHDGKVCIATITAEMLERSHAVESDLELIASIPLSIKGTVMGVTIREKGPEFSKISVRTNSGVSAIDVCSAFGGGGHFSASGCTLTADYTTAKTMLLKRIDEVMNERNPSC